MLKKRGLCLLAAANLLAIGVSCGGPNKPGGTVNGGPETPPSKVDMWAFSKIVSVGDKIRQFYHVKDSVVIIDDAKNIWLSTDKGVTFKAAPAIQAKVVENGIDDSPILAVNNLERILTHTNGFVLWNNDLIVVTDDHLNGWMAIRNEAADGAEAGEVFQAVAVSGDKLVIAQSRPNTVVSGHNWVAQIPTAAINDGSFKIDQRSVLRQGPNGKKGLGLTLTEIWVTDNNDVYILDWGKDIIYRFQNTNLNLTRTSLSETPEGPSAPNKWESGTGAWHSNLKHLSSFTNIGDELLLGFWQERGVTAAAETGGYLHGKFNADAADIKKELGPNGVLFVRDGKDVYFIEVDDADGLKNGLRKLKANGTPDSVVITKSFVAENKIWADQADMTKPYDLGTDKIFGHITIGDDFILVTLDNGLHRAAKTQDFARQ